MRLMVRVTAVLSSLWVRCGLRRAMFLASLSLQVSISRRKAASTPAVPFFRPASPAY